jgi:small GTP-binding protein
MSKVLKIVVVGDGAVGKTCLLVVYSKGSFPSDYLPTVFENYKTKIVIDNIEYNVQLWDTAGQEELENVRVLSYPNTDCFLFCFSVADRRSFETVQKKWIEEVKQNRGNTNPIYMLVGTKSDLRGSAESTVSVQEAKAMAHAIGAFGYVECSAMLNQNVKEVIDRAIHQIVAPGGGCCCVQ